MNWIKHGTSGSGGGVIADPMTRPSPPVVDGQDKGAIPGSREPDPSSTGSGPSGFDPERKSLVEHMRETLDPHVFAALRRSFEDADYNREYEQKGLSAWESPEYRPYCLSCDTMRRMEHRDYGYQCSVCGTKCAIGGSLASAIEAASAGETTKIDSTEGESAARQGDAQ